MEYAVLSNGVKMPLEGFGVFQVPDHEVCRKAVLDAISAGYRLIDTAALYANEEAVGSAVREATDSGIVKREELFITTKLWTSDMGYENAKKGFERCMSKLGLDYLDMLLIHHPYGDVYGAWKAMTELYNEGRIKALGVSNFYEGKFTEFCEIVDLKPMVNQIETHPFYTRYPALENMKQYGCVPQAWAPLAEGKHGIFTHPVLSEIGEKYGRTAAQVALRWNVQRGVCVLPKSVHKERIEQNFAVWDFNISDEDMKRIDTLDTGRSEIIDINDPNAVKFLLSIKVG